MAKTNANTIITGKSGKGKSWMFGYLVEQSNKPRVLWDIKDEHQGLATHNVVLTGDRWRMMQAKGPAKVWPEFLQSYPSVRITTKGLSPSKVREAAASCAATVHEIGRRLWAASEYHIIAPNKLTPEETLVLHTDARTCGVDIIIDAQRPALTDTTVMSQPNRRLGFGMDDPNDLKRTAGYFAAVPVEVARGVGVPVTPSDAKGGLVPAVRVMPHLPPRRALYLNCDSGEQVLLDTSQLTRRVAHHG